MVSFQELERLVKDEIIQMKEEGYDVAKLEKSFRLLEGKMKSIPELIDFLKDLEKSMLRSDFKYKEPTDLQMIKAECPKEVEKVKVNLSDSDLYDKIYGGWLGRCAGCLLGKPVEGESKEHIDEWLKVANAYPLANYFPAMPGPLSKLPDWYTRRVKRWKDAKANVLLGTITNMPRDDDIDYTLLGLYILETYGQNFTTMNVGEAWTSRLPYYMTYTAERAAYRNLVDGLLPPETATYLNPYREWIGAQIRADMWGYVTPGMPDLGAKLAHRDATLSHVKNGVYGEMFVSAMISAAFTTNDIEKIIETGLACIPKNSRLTETIHDLVCWCKQYNNWEDAWSKMMEKYGHYHWIHTFNNAAIVIIGLLYGKGDLEKSICISVMGGLDTDCNGATAGSIVGTMLGAKALPEKWIKPLNNQVESAVIGYNNSRISELAKRTLKISKVFLKNK